MFTNRLLCSNLKAREQKLKMSKFHIDEVFCKDDANIYPLQVYFQNGYPTDGFKSQQCFLQQNNTNSRVVSTDMGGLIYTGTEQNEDLWQSVILARDRNTGKVRLIEIGVADLKPIIDIDKLEDNSPAETSVSNLELSRKFGSKKQKQQMEQIEKLKVNEETVTEQMQNVTENMSEDKLDLSSYNKTDNDEVYVPQIDRKALKAEDVYDINKILTEEQYQRIYEEIESKDYTANMQPFLKTIVSSKKNIKHIVLGVYTDALMKLFLAPVKDIVKKNYVVCEFSSTLNDIALEAFTNRGRGRSLQLKDKTLCHVIVFSLLLNNLKLDLQDLCSALKLTPNTASVKVRVTGASVVTTGGKKIVQLKLPLNNPSTFRRKSSKF